MSMLLNHKTNFTSGEVSCDVLGRSDLSAYENGAVTLKNVFIDPIGGVYRRSGLRYVDEINDAIRLISFAFNTEQTYLFVVCDEKIIVYQNEEELCEIVTPWTAEDVPFLAWTQSADTLLVVHPDYPPKCITRTASGTFAISNWAFDVGDDGRIMQPYENFVNNAISMSTNATTGEMTVTTDKDFFTSNHVGVHIRFNSGEYVITSIINAKSAYATVIKNLGTGSSTKTWKEAAFSPARGWPSTVTFYQGRLVIGGSRDLPNKLWLSKTFHIMNFDLGTGLDDEGIEFSILSDQVNAIRGLMSGRHLQVFTSGSEWMVSGDPLTPKNIQLKRQTKVGSPTYRYVPPVDVSGATLFVSANGREVREFLFADLEQAYQAKNISLLSSHLIRYPVDMDYDAKRRLVYVIMNDGTMATLTNYRTEEVLAWSQQETQGAFISVCVVYDEVYLLVRRGNKIILETFDDDTYTDCCLLGVDETPRQVWTGVTPLIGKTVKVVADGVIQDDVEIYDDALRLSFAAQNIEVGLGYTHEIVPLPPVSASSVGATPLKAVRLVEARFRVVNTESLEVDVGSGIIQMVVPKLTDEFKLDQAQEMKSQDVCIHALGWIRDGMTPLWRISSSLPKACKIVSVTTNMKVSE